MTLEEKEILNERIKAAIETLDADYAKAQNEATADREAQGKLWNDTWEES